MIRHADVRQVLEDRTAVSVREYGRRMEETTGPFMLGQDTGPEHDRARQAVERALRVKEAEAEARILKIALAEATAIVERASTQAAGARARMDVVEDLARNVPVRLVESHLGVPDPGRHLVTWNEMFALYIFGPDHRPGRRRRRRRAREAGRAFRQHVGAEVERRRSLPGGPNPDDTVLGRLLEELPATEDEWATRTLVGTIAGGLVATIGLFCGAMDRLLDLPPARLEELRGLATELTEPERRRRVEDYLHEAARFAVSPGLLYRELVADLVVARGTERETRIPQGYRVWTSPSLANVDPYVYPDPVRFDPDRPEEGYLFFGAGLHHCVGDRMARALLYAMALPLVSRREVRREGKYRKGMPYRGSCLPKTYPRSLPVSFEA